jgi:hypothetical protein
VIRPPIILRTPTLRQFCASYVLEVAPDGCVVSFKENTRSLEQNALLWSRLTELSERLPWDGEKLTPAEYKDLLTACLRKQKVVRGVEGGLVFLGARTSQMSKSEMNDLLTLMEAFAAERGVEFGDQVVEFSR